MLRGTVDDFLGIAPSLYVAHNALCFAIRDRFPVSLGHTLVITRRRVATWFDATADEQRALFALVDEVKAALDVEHHPDGYNVGFNAGAAAGQTVMHLHVHVIPRYRGDMPDPRGGVRHVIPEKGNYLKSKEAPPPPPPPPDNDARPLSTGGDDPFLHHLHPLWRCAEQVAIVAAFVRDSGLQVLRRELLPALERGARVQLLTGDYLNITQAQALAQLLAWQRGRDDQDDDDEYAALHDKGGALEVRVVDTLADAQRRRGATRSFHPKSWRFEGPGLATAFVGSSNISKEALTRGVEWNLRVDRDRKSVV